MIKATIQHFDNPNDSRVQQLESFIKTPGNVIEVVTQPDSSALIVEVERRPEHGTANVCRRMTEWDAPLGKA